MKWLKKYRRQKQQKWLDWVDAQLKAWEDVYGSQKHVSIINVEEKRELLAKKYELEKWLKGNE